ncbi:unnamed protein product [Paramecium primaurelia]|uniref:Uncharacterized protein n=1 Tax=Paramecium primaurelia TaxID=5886 RepID=A0A8S1LDM5_PARPR|nr:unnamed protein product [Paramecium primaurelia]
MVEIQNCFLSENNYKMTNLIKNKILENDRETIHQTVQAVCEILTNAISQPIQKVLSIRLVKEMMDYHIQLVITKVSIHIIPIFQQILQEYLEKGINSKKYFSNQPDEQLMVLGKTFIRLICECIFVWNIWHPILEGQQSSFQRIYNQLIAQGFEFPRLFYFDLQKVKEFYKQSKDNLLTQASPQEKSENDPSDFYCIKQKLDKNHFVIGDLQIIRNSVLSLQNCNLNLNQQKFLKNFETAYQEYEKTKRYDEFIITIQSICLEFDDDTEDKSAIFDTFQVRCQSNFTGFCPSKHKVGGYSTDKISQFHSNNTLISKNSSPNQKQQQLECLNEKNRRIEQLLIENSIFAKQIQFFQDQINNLKQNLEQING